MVYKIMGGNKRPKTEASGLMSKSKKTRSYISHGAERLPVLENIHVLQTTYSMVCSWYSLNKHIKPPSLYNL